jgi:hypothetical protein
MNARPPGDSIERIQAGHVAATGEDVAAGLQALLARIGDEIVFNLAKGSSPYRLGMHDGLRFAEDAVVDLLRSHGYEAEQRPRDADA